MEVMIPSMQLGTTIETISCRAINHVATAMPCHAMQLGTFINATANDGWLSALQQVSSSAIGLRHFPYAMAFEQDLQLRS